MTSVYASIDHCRPLSEACSPRRIAGSATLTMVESVPTISRLMQQMARISHGRRWLAFIRLAFIEPAPAQHADYLHSYIYYIHVRLVGGPSGAALSPGPARSKASGDQGWQDDSMTLTMDFSELVDGHHRTEIERLCDAMEAAYQAGHYPKLTVERPWSAHNRVLEGEFAGPGRHPLVPGAGTGPAGGQGGPDLGLPGPEGHRPARPQDRARPWTRPAGTCGARSCSCSARSGWPCPSTGSSTTPGPPAESFQRYVLLTNYAWHVEEFRRALPGCVGPDADGRQMPAWHHQLPGRRRGQHGQHRGRPVQRQDHHRPPGRAPARPGPDDRALRGPAQPPGDRRPGAGHAPTCATTTCWTTCSR